MHLASAGARVLFVDHVCATSQLPRAEPWCTLWSARRVEGQPHGPTGSDTSDLCHPQPRIPIRLSGPPDGANDWQDAGEPHDRQPATAVCRVGGRGGPRAVDMLSRRFYSSLVYDRVSRVKSHVLARNKFQPSPRPVSRSRPPPYTTGVAMGRAAQKTANSRRAIIHVSMDMDMNMDMDM